jgi:hypothetical protein
LVDLAVNGHPVRTPEKRACPEQSERIVRGSGIINSNVPEHILADLLRQIHIDAQEIGWVEIS